MPGRDVHDRVSLHLYVNTNSSFFSDFIKIEKDDTVNPKGKGGDLNKWVYYFT